MDLSQQKLTRAEWEYLEVPVIPKELKILQLIFNSYENTNYAMNESQSLLGFMKINTNNFEFHKYLFDRYFKKQIDKMIKKYNLSFIYDNKKTTKKIKTADLIRNGGGDAVFDECGTIGYSWETSGEVSFRLKWTSSVVFVVIAFWIPSTSWFRRFPGKSFPIPESIHRR